MRITVRNNDVMKAYRILKKKLHNENVIREYSEKQHFVKKSDENRLKRMSAIRRNKKEQEKRLAEK